MANFWDIQNKKRDYSCLDGDIQTDVAIIGGGLCGQLTAFILKQNNIESTVIDCAYPTECVSANSSAKITAQHGMLYKNIIRNYGKADAEIYARHQLDALNEYKRIIAKNNIDCGFEEVFTCLYANQQKNYQELSYEHNACLQADLKPRLSEKTALPFASAGALYLDNQAQFNPLMFLDFLTKNIKIYYKSRALGIDVKNNTVFYERGKIQAKYIIVTTHYPFMDSLGHFYLRMHQERSYVVALKDAQIDGAYLGIDDEQLSFRTYKDYILLGGGGHRAGDNFEGGQYARLKELGRQFYPDAKSVSEFSAQDCITQDNLPFIGHYSKKSEKILMASGFNKWGMTNAMNAALLFCAYIKGEINTFPKVFNPRRQNFFPSFLKLCVDGGHLVSGIFKQNFILPKTTLNDIKIGGGGLIKYKSKKYGAYRKSENEVYLVNTRCPHKGCQLQFNPDELTWECPCHGSRFNYEGEVIDGPSQVNIALRIETDE